MGDVKARVSSLHGQTIGYFINPKVEILCEKDCEISGIFVDEQGQPYDRIEFNPEVVPYVVDLSAMSLSGLPSLNKVYVQRGRQPVRMTGIKP